MTEKKAQTSTTEPTITVEEVNRVLEVGRLLFSVLTPDEVEQLKQFLMNRAAEHFAIIEPVLGSEAERIGNTGVT